MTLFGFVKEFLLVIQRLSRRCQQQADVKLNASKNPGFEVEPESAAQVWYLNHIRSSDFALVITCSNHFSASICAPGQTNRTLVLPGKPAQSNQFKENQRSMVLVPWCCTWQAEVKTTVAEWQITLICKFSLMSLPLFVLKPQLDSTVDGMVGKRTVEDNKI